MHLAVTIFILTATWRWGDWRNWRKYNALMLYVAMGNLLYNLLYSDHLLWQLIPDSFGSRKVGEMVYSFLVFPLTAMLLLTNYPKELDKQFLRILKFVAIYIGLEFLFYRFGRIKYQYGWNIWWSVAWDCLMFPLMILNFKKPLLCYIFSLAMIIAMLFLFPVSLN